MQCQTIIRKIYDQIILSILVVILAILSIIFIILVILILVAVINKTPKIPIEKRNLKKKKSSISRRERDFLFSKFLLLIIMRMTCMFNLVPKILKIEKRTRIVFKIRCRHSHHPRHPHNHHYHHLSFRKFKEMKGFISPLILCYIIPMPGRCLFVLLGKLEQIGD